MLNVNSRDGAPVGVASGAEPEYEPWVFQMMLAELSSGELGIGFVYALLERLAERHSLDDVVLVLADESFGVQTFRLGGRVEHADMVLEVGIEPGVYCVPPVVSEVEIDAVRVACQLALSLQLARFRAGQDSLTNIANRRSFDAALDVAAARSARYGWPFTLVMVDIDGFKSINDERGHEYGDFVLRQFGFALRRSVRGGDVPARIGGDEFAVILNNAEGSEALSFMDRLRVQLKSGGTLIDFSHGTASSPKESTDSAELMRIADKRLYEKKGGTRS